MRNQMLDQYCPHANYLPKLQNDEEFLKRRRDKGAKTTEDEWCEKRKKEKR